PRRGRRMTGSVAARLDPILKLTQIEAFHIGPDDARPMVLPDQAFDIYGAQLDLVALGLAETRRFNWRRIELRLRLLPQSLKQFVASHHRLLRIIDRSESQQFGIGYAHA